MTETLSWLDGPNGVKLLDKDNHVLFDSNNQQEIQLPCEAIDILKDYAETALKQKRSRRRGPKVLGMDINVPEPQPYLQTLLSDLKNDRQKYQMTVQFAGAHSNRNVTTPRTTDKLPTSKSHPVRASLLHEIMPNVSSEVRNKLCCGAVNIYLRPIYLPAQPLRPLYTIHIMGGLTISPITGEIAKRIQAEQRGTEELPGEPGTASGDRVLQTIRQELTTYPTNRRYSAKSMRSGTLCSVARVGQDGEPMPEISRHVLGKKDDSEPLHVLLLKAFGFKNILTAMEESITDLDDKENVAPSFVVAILHRLWCDQQRRLRKRTKKRRTADGYYASSSSESEEAESGADEPPYKIRSTS